MSVSAPDSRQYGLAGEDDMGQFLRDISQYPLLSEQEEKSLAASCARGDEAAVRKMVSSNLRLVVSVAKEYAGLGVPLLDLIQEGSIGLLTAAKKFDPDYGFRFSTYATKWIRRGVTQCLRDHANVIRIPSYTMEKIRSLQKAKAELSLRGQEITDEKLAQILGVSTEKVQKLMQLIPSVTSLDAPFGEDGGISLQLEDVQSPHPQQKLIREELAAVMEMLLSRLTERQQKVLRLHFGMEDEVCHSLEDIGVYLGVSKERVRQIEQQAMLRLKKEGIGLGLEDFLDE